MNPSSTNTVLHDAPIVGPTNITELEEILHLYADSTGRIVLWPRNLSVAGLDFSADKSLNRREATLALDAFFARRGIGMLDVGEKWVSAMSSAGCQTSADSTRQINYVTHVQHLTYVTPSELVATLQPLSSGVVNPILPIDSQQTLVLRDLPQNLERMRGVIRELNVPTPTDPISEVIPVKYAKASEIAAALESLSTNAAKTPLLERMEKRLHRTDKNFHSHQIHVTADERTNSLLVYAGREDMKQIKEIISHLDLVAAQILIEAVIIEVNRTNGTAIQPIDDREVSWMTNFVPIAVTNAPPVSQPTRATRPSGEPGFYRFAAISNDLDSFVSILATNGSVRILQRPRIQTSDGEPARMFIGESRPYSEDMYPSGAYTCGSPMQTFNLGVTLELTPSITSDTLVTLDIHQFIETANGSVTIANVGEVPITHRTEQDAKVIVRNGDVLLLDGSIERDNTPPRPSKLKRVFTLNGLFHHSSPPTNHNELIVLIRPRILPTPEVAAQISKAEKDRMPRVKRAETEVQSEEANRLRQLEKNLKSDRDLGTK